MAQPADRRSARLSAHKPVAESAGGIVTAQSRPAAEAGARVLAEGGNAVDAAIATSFAAGVVEPWMSGIGGGALMLVYSAAKDRVEAFDFGMLAPKDLDPADYPLDESGGEAGDLFGWPRVVEDRNLVGATAIGVPGQVAGLGLVHERYAEKDWRALLAPAIDLAEDGLPIDAFALYQIANSAAALARDPGSREVFLEDGLPPGPVESNPVKHNPALVATLKTLAAEGAGAFYEGPLARSIVKEVQALGGCLSAADLSGYRASNPEPLQFDHRGLRLSVLPELNGGPTIKMALDHLAAHGSHEQPDGDFFAAFSEAMLRAFRYRLEELGDQDGRRGESCTTHISVVDADGNMVALTQTLLSAFGARVTLPESGIAMNNAINWFDPRPGTPNAIGPGKRPLCNYVPVIGECEGLGGARRFAIGASGGRKIIPAMAQLSLFLGRFGMSLEDALHQPRVDVSGPETIAVDPRIGPEVIRALQVTAPVELVRWSAAPNTHGVAGAVLCEAGGNWGGTEPSHPWAEAVSEEETAALEIG